MSKKTIEVLLKSLQISENGELGEKGNNAFLISFLHAEAPMPPFKQELSLKDDETVDYVNGTNAETQTRYTELERLIFKKEVNQYVWLNVLITDVHKPNWFDRFLGSLMKGIFNFTFGSLLDLLSNDLLKIPATATQDEILNLMDKNDNQTTIIAYCEKKLSVADLPDPGNSAEITLDLVTPERVCLTKPKYNTQTGHWEKVIKKDLLKGTLNGKLTLTINGL